MKDRQSLGDTPPEQFRRQLHELANWIADFRENIEALRVAPDDKPGAIGARLAKHPPEEAAPFARKRGLAGRADLPRFRIYTSDQAHNAAEKAAIALGIGEENVRRVPCDGEDRKSTRLNSSHVS